MSLKSRFSEQDLERIRLAVKAAESKISGEIVPVFVEKSSSYEFANYRAAMVFAAVAFLIIIIVDTYFPAFAIFDPFWIFVVVAGAGIVGAILANSIDPVRKLFLSREYLDFATSRRAQSAFLSEEVFNTRQRTGIMIFISFFEHKVIVLADSGISKLVPQAEWDALVEGIIRNIRQGKLVEGTEAAIRRCGEILLEKGFVISPDDINELKDDLRLDEK
jgi:putative membrane protein